MNLLPDTQFLIYRDDANHPTVSGNKLHKLKPNLSHALNHGYETILSFGGPYSNHLHALAYACKEAGLSSIGVVRGELQPELTPTLKDCQDWGMKIIGLSRKAYRNYQETLGHKKENTWDVKADLPELASHIKQAAKTLILPEGANNHKAINELANAYSSLFERSEYAGVTYAVCATGTGATVAGLSKAAPSGVKVIGVQAVAEGDATLKRIRSLLGKAPENLSIVPGHLGRFAKLTDDLKSFIIAFEDQHGIPLDPVYNAKVLYKLLQMHSDGFFSANDKVLIIHTGGLQGNRGYRTSW